MICDVLLKNMKKLITVVAMLALAGCGKRDDNSIVYTQQDGSQTEEITQVDGKVSYQAIALTGIEPPLLI